MTKIKTLLLYFICFVWLHFIFTGSVFAKYKVLVHDDFSNGISEEWMETVGFQGSWDIQDQEYIGSVTRAGVDEPSISSIGDVAWKNYEFELNVKNELGVDKMILFRYHSLNHTYVLNMVSGFVPDGGNKIVLSKNSPSGNFILADVPYSNSTQTWYQLKIIVNNNDIKVFIDGQDTALIHEIDDFGYIEDGGIALVAWPGEYAGSGSVTKVHFDNVIVRNLDELDVRFFSQNDPAWGDDPYGTLGYIHNKGCAMTSAAMVFDYFGVNSIEATDSAGLIDLTPKSLNAWLNAQPDGYTLVTDPDTKQQARGGVNWPILVSWAYKRHEIGNREATVSASPKLEFTYSPKMDSEQLNTDLANGVPVILNVSSGNHFLVAKGKVDDTYLINDPEDLGERLDVDTYDNTFVGTRKFEVTNTNLSSQVFYTLPYTHIFLTDSQGRRVGKDPVTQTELNEIPGAYYAYEPPIIEPNSSEAPDDNLGVNVLYINDPLDGNYVLQAFNEPGSSNGFQILHWSYDRTANVHQQTYEGSVEPGEALTWKFDYDQESGDSIVTEYPEVDEDEEVTFDSVAQKIREGVQNGQIKKARAVAWMTELVVAEKLAAKNVTKKGAERILKALEIQIVKATPKFIDTDLSQKIREDLKILREQL